MTDRDQPSSGQREDQMVGDEAQLMRAVERSFAFWAMGIELMRATVDDWAQRRQKHLHEAMKALGEVEQLASEQDRATAVSNVVFDQMENIVKDLTAASLRAMSYQGALARKLGEDMRDDVAHMAASTREPFPSAPPGSSNQGAPGRRPPTG